MQHVNDVLRAAADDDDDDLFAEFDVDMDMHEETAPKPKVPDTSSPDIADDMEVCSDETNAGNQPAANNLPEAMAVDDGTSKLCQADPQLLMVQKAGVHSTAGAPT